MEEEELDDEEDGEGLIDLCDALEESLVGGSVEELFVDGAF